MKLHQAAQTAKKLKALFTQRRELRAYLDMAPVKSEIIRAGMAIATMDPEDPLREMRNSELEEVIRFLHLARFTATKASANKDKEAWKTASGYFATAKRRGKDLRVALETGSRNPVPFPALVKGRVGDGLETADGVPMVPPILPVVFLMGSDREMGRQYSLQLAARFGTWILEKKCGRVFSEEELRILGLWEAELVTHAPEIIPFAEGMAEGARALGLKMSYMDALEIWTGVLPPETDYFGAGGRRMSTVPPLACSGVAAWGESTSDGKLVTGSAGDFDPTFTATIVAWPDSGNAYVFTPFGATGDVPALGSVNMFGHPGMNSKGLVYVHHGGTPKMIEPKETWGYGIRRAAGVLHILRYANDARQALDMELSFPVGDAGLDSGTVGGFWADDGYGFVLESRKDPVLLREAGLLGERSFLYSANSALHPRAGDHGWLALERAKWDWSAPGGWIPKHFSFFHKLGLVYHGSAKRCAAFYSRLSREFGSIDLLTILECYGNGGTIPQGDWKEIVKAYNKSGVWGELSPGNASNGILAFTKPSEGRYSVCVGPLKRGIPPTSPLFASVNPVFGETNAFWDLHLALSPEECAKAAAAVAQSFLAALEEALQEALQGNAKPLSRTRASLRAEEARKELEEGYNRTREALELEGDPRIGMTAAAATSFLRAQVRARQALGELRGCAWKETGLGREGVDKATLGA
jgi:hypothetical protein